MRLDAFMTRIVVLVDEATEPTLSENEVARRRGDLVAMANSAVQSGGAGGNTAGHNIAYAIRKRLKSDEPVAVMNTLKLLDELMRSCAYFFRYVADDKMFRRLWRFVVPDYKNGVRSLFPFSHRSRSSMLDMHAAAGKQEIAEMVLILIRAWAEELSVLYDGKIVASASFLIERYNSKRERIDFPEIPDSELPWVCPVGPNAKQKAANVYSLVGGSAGVSAAQLASIGSSPVLPNTLSYNEMGSAA
eukprot:IDg11907t1